MEDSFEKYIREHRKEFDDAEPSAKHAQLFEEKLAGKPKPSSLTIIWWAAAAVVVLFIGINTVLSTISPVKIAPANTNMTLSQVSSSMAQVEAFYSEEIVQSKNMLSAISNNSKELELLQVNLAGLEKQYDFLKAELAIHQGDQRIITRMIENYRMRLKMLEKHLILIQKYHVNHKSVPNENA
jgi:hypothetical protein